VEEGESVWRRERECAGGRESVEEGESSGLGRVAVVCFCCVAGRDGRKFVAIC
jgi:hypothetical protein